MERSYFVYIMSNKWNTTFYVGVTNNLARRVSEHKKAVYRNSFTARYYVSKLVYFEETSEISGAIYREKQLKNWHRQWKKNLIQQYNPQFRDLSTDFMEIGDSETSSE